MNTKKGLNIELLVFVCARYIMVWIIIPDKTAMTNLFLSFMHESWAKTFPQKIWYSKNEQMLLNVLLS